VPDDLLVHTADGVATVVLNRPERLNAMMPDLQKCLLSTLAELDRSPDIRAIVLTGAGRAFCAGADLDVLATIDALVGTDAVQAIAPGLATPMIAAVNGPAIGIGFSIMLLADVIYLGDGVSVASKFAQLGLVAEWGSAWTLQCRVGYGCAADLLMTGRSVSADEALQIGLAQRVVPVDRLLPQAQKWARSVAHKTSPFSASMLKHQLHAARTQSFSDAFALSVALEVSALCRPDLTEAMLARSEGRVPKFPSYDPH
jgi:enoyl-CoA hydratase/carnithine racemase